MFSLTEYHHCKVYSEEDSDYKMIHVKYLYSLLFPAILHCLVIIQETYSESYTVAVAWQQLIRKSSNNNICLIWFLFVGIIIFWWQIMG